MSWYYNFSMKTDHIPILSYVFIGVTSLVLTYATIADTTDEVILPPPSSVGTESQSSAFSSISGTIDKIKTLNPFATSATASGQEEIPVAVPASTLPSLSGAIDKIKSLNPFSSSGQEELPVAVPVPVAPSAPTQPSTPSYGGKKSTKHRKRKQKKTRRSSK
jgi:hypothetical protein